ncbi:hypothetical protein [Labrys monachus]|uniref:DUF2125 domain-containing protein n=1 Tax=Labrys monachus TaxID=217067 RepID=A0ABU0FKD4_9HYPH|nr:hypothetical protein [Labrys monachus]MDQ0395060.1 hypothetical protein [Labrys monachus]
MSILHLVHRAGRAGMEPRRLSLLATTVLGLGLAVPARAAPATEEGARDLQATLQKHLGSEIFDKGVLTIVPSGDSYDFILDPDKAPRKPDEPQPALPAVTLHVTPADDGSYAFTSDPVSFDSAAPAGSDAGQSSSSGRVDNCTAEGRFNPDALYLSTLTARCDGIAVKDRSPGDPMDLDIGKASLQWTGKPADDGTADITMSLELPDIAGTFADKGSAGPDAGNRFSIGSIHYAVSLDHVRAREIGDLVSLWIAAGDKGDKEPPTSDVRAKVRAALPLWDTLHTEMGIEDIGVEIPGMAVKIGHYGEKHTLSGVVKDAHYGLDFDVSGVEFSGGETPDWFRGILPSKAAIGLKVADVDLAAMADAVLEAPDDGPSKLKDTLPALLLNGKASVAGNASVTAPSYDVEGHGEAPIDPKMQGTAMVSATGFDAIMSAANKFATKDTRSMLLGFALMKGLAKAGPDGRLTWDLAVDVPAKKVSVNGQVFNLPKK